MGAVVDGAPPNSFGVGKIELIEVADMVAVGEVAEVLIEVGEDALR